MKHDVTAITHTWSGEKKRGDDPGARASPAVEAEVLDITILRTPQPPRPGPPPSDPSPLRGGGAEGMDGGREGKREGEEGKT